MKFERKFEWGGGEGSSRERGMVGQWNRLKLAVKVWEDGGGSVLIQLLHIPCDLGNISKNVNLTVC